MVKVSNLRKVERKYKESDFFVEPLGQAWILLTPDNFSAALPYHYNRNYW